jgi:hypothetical protein
MPPIPDAKLIELLLTEPETKQLIIALDRCLTASMPHGSENALLGLRAQLRRGLNRPA